MLVTTIHDCRWAGASSHGTQDAIPQTAARSRRCSDRACGALLIERSPPTADRPHAVGLVPVKAVEPLRALNRLLGNL